ncbi:hypothetical protein [Mycobacterium sp. MS1601]|uniref:hypothetical protein n=1 Tax=Mycobacterium sp. MS1601 TaxID=1936029 RepID=UPI0009FAFCAF|nr:hypothetical protein [Mycobacterium sp. MS1601]
MARAAEAPDTPLGRRLYTVRRRANLTVEDAALAAALPVGVVESLEEDQPVAAHVIAGIEELVTQLDT